MTISKKYFLSLFYCLITFQSNFIQTAISQLNEDKKVATSSTRACGFCLKIMKSTEHGCSTCRDFYQKQRLQEQTISQTNNANKSGTKFTKR